MGLKWQIIFLLLLHLFQVVSEHAMEDFGHMTFYTWSSSPPLLAIDRASPQDLKANRCLWCASISFTRLYLFNIFVLLVITKYFWAYFLEFLSLFLFLASIGRGCCAVNFLPGIIECMYSNICSSKQKQCTHALSSWYFLPLQFSTWNRQQWIKKSRCEKRWALNT